MHESESVWACVGGLHLAEQALCEATGVNPYDPLHGLDIVRWGAPPGRPGCFLGSLIAVLSGASPNRRSSRQPSIGNIVLISSSQPLHLLWWWWPSDSLKDEEKRNRNGKSRPPPLSLTHQSERVREREREREKHRNVEIQRVGDHNQLTHQLRRHSRTVRISFQRRPRWRRPTSSNTLGKL